MEKQYIQPDFAAHNIATAFCQQYISKNFGDCFCLDTKDLLYATENVANLYGIVYDVAYNKIDSQNDKE